MSWTEVAKGVASVVVAAGGLVALSQRVPDMVNQSAWGTRRRLREMSEAKWGGVRLTPGTYTPNPPMEDAVEYHVRAFTGVHVLAAPSGAGKTTATARAIRAARGHAKHSKRLGVAGSLAGPFPVTGQVYVSCSGHPSLKEALSTLFGCHEPEDVLRHGTVIVIDHLDEVLPSDSPGLQECKGQILKLAQRGLETKVFNTIVLVQDPDFAKLVCTWNGGHKISRVKGDLRMQEGAITELANRIGKAHGVPDRMLQSIKRAAPAAAAPGFVVATAAECAVISPDQVASKARTWESAWAESGNAAAD